MKNNFKRIICLLLAIFSVFSMSIAVFADAYDSANAWTAEEDGSNVLNDVYEMYSVIHSLEFFSIYKADFFDGITYYKDVYFVVCRGLDVEELNFTKPRSLGTVIKAMFSNENNSYVKAIVNAVNLYCEKNSNIVFLGHSLGGMIIEQASANKTLKNNFSILYTITLGSPYILTSTKKEGKLIRFADKSDPVPFLSIPLLANPLFGDKVIYGKSNADSIIMVHFDSYSGDNGVDLCWNGYDILGNYNGGGAFVTLNECVFAPEK